MPTDTTNLYTMHDLINLKDPDYAGLLMDTLTQFPLLNALPAFTVKETTVRQPIINGLPTGAWRQAYEGKEASKGNLTHATVDLKYFDASMGPLDVREARTNPEGGIAETLALATQLALIGAEKDIEKSIMYGDGTEAFKGLKALIDPDMVIKVGSGTTGECSDVFAITHDVRLCLGKDGTVRSGSGPELHYVSTSATAGFHAYTEEIAIWLAMLCSGKNSGARLANVDNVETLNDDMLADLKNAFEIGFGPTAFVMGPRSREQLRRSRRSYAYDETGKPLPIPTEAHGIPIITVGTIDDHQDPEA